MSKSGKEDAAAIADGLSAAEVIDQLHEALAARASRLGLDPDSISSPSPGALTVRTARGTLLRLDVCSYRPHDLGR
jgi:hypothetical protein